MTTTTVQQRDSLLPAETLVLPSSVMAASSRGRFVVPKHIVTIERFLLQALVEGDQMVTIEAPVRCGKSVYVDWHFPFWLLGTFPHKHIGLASHEQQFAQSWGAKVRDSLVEFGSSFGVRVKRDIRSRGWWEMEGHEGSMRSFGMAGGGITGRGFDVLILDDLIKNAQDAESEERRNHQIEFLRGTAMSRIEPGGLLVVMMARWHEDDLIGYVHREMPGQFKRLRLPAIAEEPSLEFPDPDPMGRKAGEPLWPQRFPLTRLAQRRKRSGEYYFNANYQQRPSPPQGAVFQRSWWKRWSRGGLYPLPDWFDVEAWSWDMSFKDSTDSSFVVGQLWGKRGSRFYLRWQVRGQWDFPTTKRMVIRCVTDPRYKIAASTVLIEDKANGTAIIADLRGVVGGLIPISTPQESKAARARSISGYVEAGDVLIPEAGEPEALDQDSELWVPGFVDEMASFPRGAKDDQVDTLSQAIRELLDRGGAEVVVPSGDLPARG